MKKQMKKFLAIILAAAAVLAFTGCGRTGRTDRTDKTDKTGKTDKTVKTIDINAVGKILNDGCSFDERPEYIDNTEFALESMAADASLVKKTDTGYAVYKAVSASTPEIILIIEAVDGKAANALNSGAVKNWIDKNIEGYSDYGPEQVPKLKGCVNKVVNNYVFLIVSCDNAAAEKLLNGQIGK